MSGHPGGVNAFLCPRRGGEGIPLPWPRLQETLGGLHAGDLFILGGRPSMGKSCAALQIGRHIAGMGHRVGVISLEMEKAAIIRRLISAESRVPYSNILTGELVGDERNRVSCAAGALETIPLYIDDKRSRTVSAIRAAARKLATDGPVSVLIIDHLQRIKGSRRAESRTLELGEITRELKYLAGDMRCTVMLLSQLNRECEKEKREPGLSDLRESGDIEQDADEVILVHRPERYWPNKPEHRGVAKFLIPKQREGVTGLVSMTFRGEFQRFDEAAYGENNSYNDSDDD